MTIDSENAGDRVEDASVEGTLSSSWVTARELNSWPSPGTGALRRVALDSVPSDERGHPSAMS